MDCLWMSWHRFFFMVQCMRFMSSYITIHDSEWFQCFFTEVNPGGVIWKWAPKISHTIFYHNISQPELILLSAGGFGFPFHGSRVTNHPAPHPALKTPAVPPAPRPAAPTLWHMANKEPEATAGPCSDAAILPAATPAAVNPTAPKTKGVAATAPAPTATGTPTSKKTLNFSPNVRRLFLSWHINMCSKLTKFLRIIVSLKKNNVH